MPHSSIRKSIEASEEIVSTRNDAGRGLAMDEQNRLDAVLAVFAQPRFEFRRVGRMAPILRQCLDIETERLAAHSPVQREKPAFDDQNAIPRREQIDQRRLPSPVPGRGIGQDRPVGLEHVFETNEAFLGDRLEFSPGEVDRAAIHRAQDAVRDIGRPRVHEEMHAVRHALSSIAPPRRRRCTIHTRQPRR
jgi:hypothetical protein